MQGTFRRRVRALGSCSSAPGLPRKAPLCYFARPVRPIRLTVRTRPSQGRNTGSIPVWATSHVAVACSGSGSVAAREVSRGNRGRRRAPRERDRSGRPGARSRPVCRAACQCAAGRPQGTATRLKPSQGRNTGSIPVWATKHVALARMGSGFAIGARLAKTRLDRAPDPMLTRAPAARGSSLDYLGRLLAPRIYCDQVARFRRGSAEAESWWASDGGDFESADRYVATGAVVSGF